MGAGNVPVSCDILTLQPMLWSIGLNPINWKSIGKPYNILVVETVFILSTGTQWVFLSEVVILSLKSSSRDPRLAVFHSRSIIQLFVPPLMLCIRTV